MRRGHNKESGMLIVEASLVFPIMFFAIIFLIYTGNVFYMRSQVDSAVVTSALEGAAYCADPMLNLIYESEDGSTVPEKSNQIKPYRYFTLIGEETGIAAEELDKTISGMGAGFFAGMDLQESSSIVEMKNYFLFQTVHASASYKIKFPMRLAFTDEDFILNMESSYIATVNDNAEFINNVDMVIDFYEASGAKDKVDKKVQTGKEKINSMTGKLGEFFGKGTNMKK